MFKVGDKVKCKHGGLDIWVYGGNIYEVLCIVVEPPTAGDKCYRNCGHPMHDPKPERIFITVNAETGRRATILDECFEKAFQCKCGAFKCDSPSHAYWCPSFIK